VLTGWWVCILAGLFGAVVGSFLNVVIYRLPERRSLVFPPSHCFSCGERLGFIDLIPVLSYLLLRGRCRFCGHRFSARYALVEAGTAALAAAAVYYYGLTPYALGVFAAGAALIVAIFIDLDHMIIPDQVPLILLGIGIAFDTYRLITYGREAALPLAEKLGGSNYVAYLPVSVVGALVGGGLFLVIGWVFERVMGRPALGLGDVKLAAGIGALLGPGYQFLAFFLLAMVSGAVISVLLIVLRIRRRDQYIPFGPMLALAAIAMLLWPDVLAPWVLHFYR
jgi:leader peptidase (prepilin peptidase)/N-methyltransferase